jgi:hypothetical protein
MRVFLATIAAALFIASAASAVAQQKVWPLDPLIPAELSKRNYLSPDVASVYKEKLEGMVGVWGVLKGNVVTVTAQRPTSFGTPGSTAVVKIALAKGDPVFTSVTSKASDVNTALPILNFSWGSNEKGQITITDTAQFLVDRQPTDQDWAGYLQAGANGSRVVYIDAALLSVVQLSVLKKKVGSIAALVTGLNIGGTNYEEKSGSITSFVVSLAIKEPICRQLGNCGASIIASTEKSLSGSDLSFFKSKLNSLFLVRKSTENTAATVPINETLNIKVSDKSLAELMVE